VPTPTISFFYQVLVEGPEVISPEMQIAIYTWAKDHQNTALLTELAGRYDLATSVVAEMSTLPHASVRAVLVARRDCDPEELSTLALTEKSILVQAALAKRTDLSSEAYVKLSAAPSRQVALALCENPSVPKEAFVAAAGVLATTMEKAQESEVVRFRELVESSISTANALALAALAVAKPWHVTDTILAKIGFDAMEKEVQESLCVRATTTLRSACERFDPKKTTDYPGIRFFEQALKRVTAIAESDFCTVGTRTRFLEVLQEVNPKPVEPSHVDRLATCLRVLRDIPQIDPTLITTEQVGAAASTEELLDLVTHIDPQSPRIQDLARACMGSSVATKEVYEAVVHLVPRIDWTGVAVLLDVKDGLVDLATLVFSEHTSAITRSRLEKTGDPDGVMRAVAGRAHRGQTPQLGPYLTIETVGALQVGTLANARVYGDQSLTKLILARLTRDLGPDLVRWAIFEETLPLCKDSLDVALRHTVALANSRFASTK
jgi:hypothetical protein